MLRNSAASLRLKAHAGELAVSAAKDLAVILPRELASRVEVDITSGSLQKRWAEAVTRARMALPSETADEEVHLAALADLLAWHGKQASRVSFDYALRIEGDRRAAEGRAQGIEEALEAEEDKPAQQA